MSKYSNSPLVDFILLSPNFTEGRTSSLNPTGVIDKITIHHMAGNLSVETCGRVFQDTTRQASSNYGVGTDGRVGMYVEEKNRAWTSSNRANDIRAITIEVANDGGSGWHVSDEALNATIKLCIDICKRNSIKKINFTGDANGNLTMHKYFTNTLCPGPYLESKFQYISDQINLALAEIGGDSTEESAPSPTPSKMAGKSVVLEDCNIYVSSTSARRHSKISGTYYVWSDEIVNDRVKITNEKSRVGVKGQVTGWVNYSSISDQVEGPKVDDSVVPPAAPEKVDCVSKWIWDFLDSVGLKNDYAKAGIIGNLDEESGLKPTNLQDSYEDDFGHGDESYTAAVDSGVYTNFVNDKAGYGLAQWTWWSRKEGLLNFAKSQGKSIGSLSMQMEFFWKEIQGFGLLDSLTAVTSVREASNLMLMKYEAPADQSERTQDRRAKTSQKYYDLYAGSTPSTPSNSDSPQDEIVPPVSQEFPEIVDKPDVEISVFNPYTVKVVFSLNIRTGPGTNYDVRGETRQGTFTIVEEKDGPGSSKWGLLKSYSNGRNGWISLDLKDLAAVSEEVVEVSEGDTVRIKSSAERWTTGQIIPGWVKMRTLYVRSKPSKGVCQVSTLKSGPITGLIDVRNLSKV